MAPDIDPRDIISRYHKPRMPWETSYPKWQKVLAAIFFSPLAIYLHDGFRRVFYINLVLWILGIFPGEAKREM